MKTKIFLLAFAAIVMLSGMVGAQYNNALSLVNLSVSPNPVMAGGNANIKFQLYNSYESWVYGTSMQPSGSYPILNVSPLGSTIVGQLNPGLNAKYYNYTIQIPNTTPSGSYTINFNANYFVYAALGTQTAMTDMPVTFYVNNRPDIKVVASTPQGGALYTGYNQTVDLAIENIGYGTARNVTVAISGGQGINVLSSVRSFFIANMTHGTSVTEPILVSAKNLGGTYLVASTSYYSSNLQQNYGGPQRVNLSIAPSAQFTLGSMYSGISPGATDVPVHLIVTNNGTSAAEQLQLTLETTYPVTPVATTAYISDLQPGTSTNVTFLVSVDTAGVPGNYPVTLYEQWKQPNGAPNQQFSGSTNYFVTVANKGGGVSTIAVAVVIIVIAAVAGMVVRRRMAKASKDKKADKKK